MALLLTGTFYLTMVAAGYVIELVFTPLHLVPDTAAARVAWAPTGCSWNYTTWLNIVFLAARGRAGRALLPDRRRADAVDDGRRSGRHGRARPLPLTRFRG